MASVPSIEVVPKTVEQSLSTNTLVQQNQSTTQTENKQLTPHLFDRILRSNHLFVNHDLLHSTFVPEILPHREQEITELAQILSPALNHETPSNVIIYGPTGTGKTAVVKLVKEELQVQGKTLGKQIHVLYINSELVNTLYKIFQNIGQQLINNPQDIIPLNGLSMDTLFNKITARIDTHKQIIVLILDEANQIVDDALYTLTRINEHLHHARVSLICISNNLKFVELQDSKVQSSLCPEKLVFSPYDAQQIQDILRERAKSALKSDTFDNEVIPLCAALSAREHGDARKALDLLRVSAEIAERNGDLKITKQHVRLAQKKIESDCTTEIVHNLPFHSKLVIIAILKIQKEHRGAGISEVMTTGDVYDYYRRLCEKVDFESLTQRRCADYISELDSVGLITARVISKGRQGRTKEIALSASPTEINEILQEDEILKDLLHYNLKFQRRLI